MKQFFVGVDLGKHQDHTAAVVLERIYPNKAGTGDYNYYGRWEEPQPDTTKPARYICRGVDRFPLMTEYTVQVEKIAQLVNTPPLKGNYSLLIDRGNAGTYAYEQFRREGLNPRAITITGMGQASRVPGGYNVPKIDLVSVLLVLLQSDRLSFDKGSELAPLLIDELQNFKLKYTENANLTFNAREGKHDDIVLACAMPAWYAERYGPETKLDESVWKALSTW